MNAVKNVAPLWTYAFNHSFSFPAWGPNFAFCNGHVCHGSELPYLFNTAQYLGYSFTPDEAQLAAVMAAYWTNFGWTGNPNQGPSHIPINWPQYNATNRFSSLNMSPPSYTILSDSAVSKNCDFWDRVGYRRGWDLFNPKLVNMINNMSEYEEKLQNLE